MKEANTLAKVDLGTKLTCLNCGARYYDLNKDPALCPKCGSENEPTKVFKVKKIETNSKPEKDKASIEAKDDVIVAEIDDDLDSIDPEDDNVTVVEDDDDLNANNDVGSVIGTIDSSKDNDL